MIPRLSFGSLSSSTASAQPPVSSPAVGHSNCGSSVVMSCRSRTLLINGCFLTWEFMHFAAQGAQAHGSQQVCRDSVNRPLGGPPRVGARRGDLAILADCDDDEQTLKRRPPRPKERSRHFREPAFSESTSGMGSENAAIFSGSWARFLIA
jgi:hypothetical protein